MKTWYAIAAMAKNRVIGNKNTIPWKIAEDFKWVSRKTRGQAIVMGRLTYESIGRPLPNRNNIVISRTLKPAPGITVLPSLQAVESLDLEMEIWLFGGANIYRQALPRCSHLYLSVIKEPYSGDTFFPFFEDRFTLQETVKDYPEFTIFHYLNANPQAL